MVDATGMMAAGAMTAGVRAIAAPMAQSAGRNRMVAALKKAVRATAIPMQLAMVIPTSGKAIVAAMDAEAMAAGNGGATGRKMDVVPPNRFRRQQRPRRRHRQHAAMVATGVAAVTGQPRAAAIAAAAVAGRHLPRRKGSKGPPRLPHNRVRHGPPEAIRAHPATMCRKTDWLSDKKKAAVPGVWHDRH